MTGTERPRPACPPDRLGHGTTEKTVQDDSNLPAQLTIHLIRAEEAREEEHGRWTETRFVATSPLFPGLALVASSSEDAVRDLLWQILDSQDLSPDVVAALKAAGHSDEVVAAWGKLAYGSERKYRYDAEASVQVLQEYVDGGVPALVACRYLGQGIVSASLAIEAYAAGGVPEDVWEYVHHSETYKWWKWDYDIDPWIRSGFPFARGKLYAMDCSVESAREWEEVVTQYDIPDGDIGTLLRSTFTPSSARAHLEAEGGDPASLIVEARQSHPPEPDPRGGPGTHGDNNPADTRPALALVEDPWGSPGTAAEEPPF